MSRLKQNGYYLYSVYDKRTDMPIIIDGTSRECAAAMGVKPCSFPALFMRCRKGLGKKWEIFKGELVHKRKQSDYEKGISQLNIDTLRQFLKNGKNVALTAESEYMTITNVYYHLHKFRSKYGLNPCVEGELQQLIEKLGDKIAV